MTNFSTGDAVRVVTGTRIGQLGKIKDVVPNVTADEHFQAYVVVFDGDGASLPEHYLQYELQSAN
jgi:hypothetical protein